MVGFPPKPERRWYVRVDDHVDGPHPESRVKAWLKDGTLPRDVLLSADARTWRRVKLGGRTEGRESPA